MNKYSKVERTPSLFNSMNDEQKRQKCLKIIEEINKRDYYFWIDYTKWLC